MMWAKTIPYVGMRVSVGVFAHNEGRSLDGCLQALFSSRAPSVAMAEVLVVSSGSTDTTDAVAHAWERREARVRLLRQPARLGKARAVNLFLAQAASDVLVLVNADTILQEDALEALVSPLADPRVGLVGGHPVPVAVPPGPLGRIAELFWDLHHRLCQRALKTGELIAFRRLFDALPPDEAGADEDWIHGEVRRRGLQALYAPGAIVYNRVPRRVAEFVAHRRRLAVQHLVLRHRCGFVPASRSWRLLASATGEYLREHPGRLPLLLQAALLELAGRAWAAWSFHRHGETCAEWAPLASSKGITPEDVRRYRACAGPSVPALAIPEV
jgi:glycosyltransferase involved in cell wall biosynthesis